MINESIELKLSQVKDRYEELQALLSDNDVISDQNKFRELSKEYAEIEPVVQCFSKYQQLIDDMEAAEMMLEDDDPDMKEMAQEELKDCKAHIDDVELELQKLMLPKDPYDGCNVFLEVRAGTGGDEASIFSGDLFRMYSRYADKRGWRVEVQSQNEGDHGGFKEVICRISGDSVYSSLKFESGAHRVQRVPETESQGRVHTSACTVAVMPEPDELEAIEIRKEDLKVDTYRSQGAGGQHVNTTDSAIRITHMPTGVVVECQEERSQHKNRAKAMSVLQARLVDAQIQQRNAEQASQRKSLVGSGDRSERIRTYNFPQGRLTDHRINLTLYKLNEVMSGELDEVIQGLTNEHQAELLANLSSDSE